MKIIADSSADLLVLEGVDFASVPLKLITSEREYVDDERLDPAEMNADLARYKGRSGSSCPNPKEYLEAFGDAEEIFCITITSALSGSFDAAKVAARDYVALHPDRKVSVIDSRSAGAGITIVVERLRELIGMGLPFEEIEREIRKYNDEAHLIFALRSLHNLSANGRVSPIAARLAGILGIRIVGEASSAGKLEIVSRARGEGKMLSDILTHMKKTGYAGGRIRIHHAENASAAEALRTLLQKEYPGASISIGEARGLCSFYAERGGLMVGYEGDLLL